MEGTRDHPRISGKVLIFTSNCSLLSNLMPEISRSNNRRPDQLRDISLKPGIAPYATGSILAEFGNTKVICAATVDKKVPRWMIQQGVVGGWITAEYSMLPYSTLDRKMRDSTRGKIDGRSMEIQRLIGRSLRAVADLKKLPGYSLWIDCDVLQADGGTRTASITGAFAAARLAVEKLLAAGKLAENPFKDSVAAISAGIYRENEILDLDYVEDRDAGADFNIVMTGSGDFVEVQGSGEEATFSREQLDSLLDLGKKGIADLTILQNQVIEEESAKIRTSAEC